MEAVNTRAEKKIIWIIILAVIAVVGLLFWGIAKQYLVPTVPISVGVTTINARLATTEAQREQGLSGTPSLGPNEGMLFVFEYDNKWPIWMKNMHYPIDIVWIDAGKRVVWIERNVSPKTYPKQSFKPSLNARYVLEIEAGGAQQYGIRTGQILQFESGVEKA